jgi:hypothetical protein
MRASKPGSPRVAASKHPGNLPRLLLLVPAVLLAACASQDRLTARATGCSSRDITIVASDFKRQGVETAWCARCETKLYQCATNADRTDVQCFEAREGGPCF